MVLHDESDNPRSRDRYRFARCGYDIRAGGTAHDERFILVQSPFMVDADHAVVATEAGEKEIA